VRSRARIQLAEYTVVGAESRRRVVEDLYDARVRRGHG
jgi:hypothetical protein